MIEWLRVRINAVAVGLAALVGVIFAWGATRRASLAERAESERDAARADAGAARSLSGDLLEVAAADAESTVDRDAGAADVADAVLDEILARDAAIPVDVVTPDPFAAGAEERARILRGDGE